MPSLRRLSLLAAFALALTACAQSGYAVTPPSSAGSASNFNRETTKNPGPTSHAAQSPNFQLAAVVGVAVAGAAGPKYYTPAIMNDIKNNLGADYVRGGFIPDYVNAHGWGDVDTFMQNACNAGLQVAELLPGINDDKLGEADLIEHVDGFFIRYTQPQYKGCLKFAEVVNEADLPQNGYTLLSYFGYYVEVAHYAEIYGVRLVTTGTSGEDTSWTSRLAQLLANCQVSCYPPPEVDGYGFHPYGVAVGNMSSAAEAMGDAAGDPNGIYVTELGETDAQSLYQAIVNLEYSVNVTTVFEYQPGPGQGDQYSLKDNPALYAAFQKAIAWICSQPVHKQSCSSQNVPRRRHSAGGGS